jgi:putative addiction module killer protein
MAMLIEVREYIDATGRNAFARWFARIEATAAARVKQAITRMTAGNLGDVRPVGGGVSECRIDYGPGYRIYVGKDGEALIILLAGGTKRGQQRDIETARALWQEYRQRKRKGSGWC